MLKCSLTSPEESIILFEIFLIMETKCPVCLADIILKSKKNRITKNICANCKISLFLPAQERLQLIANDFAPIQKIGEGATSIVYKAWQLSLNRYVALKIFKGTASDLEKISQFLYESRTIGRLSHPNIVKCYSLGEANSLYYMATEFIEGYSLKKFIENHGGKLKTHEAVEIICQLSEALCYIWEKERLIHRDIKPENIMISKDGTIKLIDLGSVVKQTDWASGMEIVGSPNYMSPDQFKGNSLDFYSDIYNIGIMFYEMLSGTLPYKATTIAGIAKKHIAKEFIPLGAILPDIDKNICIIIDRMLQSGEAEKFSSMEEFKYEIQKAANSVARSFVHIA